MRSQLITESGRSPDDRISSKTRRIFSAESAPASTRNSRVFRNPLRGDPPDEFPFRIVCPAEGIFHFAAEVASASSAGFRKCDGLACFIDFQPRARDRLVVFSHAISERRAGGPCFDTLSTKCWKRSSGGPAPGGLRAVPVISSPRT